MFKSTTSNNTVEVTKNSSRTSTKTPKDIALYYLSASTS